MLPTFGDIGKILRIDLNTKFQHTKPWSAAWFLIDVVPLPLCQLLGELEGTAKQGTTQGLLSQAS